MLRLRYRFAAATVLLAAALSSSACAGPSPAPATPSGSPTPASDEEAFRAAEATYRAYVDALNAVDLADPTTFEPVFALLSEDALRQTSDSLNRMRDEGWSVSGLSIVTSTTDTRVSEQGAEIAVCVDVSEVLISDADGSAVETERPDVQGLEVRSVETDRGWKIVEFSSRDDGETC
ncbi:hypothetical protein [Microbacterium radiodurans]|uniref:Nuclear transport factor 2 family protein n=1 Tax=Microbacterium radiodurans TaxID=661398 RepID=A0A5J5IR76_9MICO|nr:hypothetical protein [Microbacterium radiodurans]KAA9087146.1 hypothetical protein F6B42_09325 [Microbacterium radiodurans]